MLFMKKIILLSLFLLVSLSVFAQASEVCQISYVGGKDVFYKGETKTIYERDVTLLDVPDLDTCKFLVYNSTHEPEEVLISKGETKTDLSISIMGVCIGTSDLAITNVQQYDDFAGLDTGIVIKANNLGDVPQCIDLTRQECQGQQVLAYAYYEANNRVYDLGATTFTKGIFKPNDEEIGVIELWKQLSSASGGGSRLLETGSYPIKVKIDPKSCVINEQNKNNNEATLVFNNKCNMNDICERDKGEDLNNCGDCGCGISRFDNTKIRMYSVESQRALPIAQGFQGAQFKGTYELGVTSIDLSDNSVVFDVNGKRSGKLKQRDVASMSGLNIFVIEVGSRPIFGPTPGIGNPSVGFCISESPEAKEELSCDGCWDSTINKCLPIGKRTGTNYCDVSKRILSQKAVDVACEEHYECSSNLCDAQRNVCLAPSIWTSFLNWLAGIFS